MILEWKGSFDEFLACLPFESWIERRSEDPKRIAAQILSLEAILAEFWTASREYQLRHTLLVERHRDAQMHLDGPPRTTDPRLQPVAFSTWHLRFGGPLSDGTRGLLGVVELTRGRSDGYERFASLAAQVVRVLIDGAAPVSEHELVTRWAVDLYMSARNGLPGLAAAPRVRHGVNGWRDLRREELCQPSTGAESAGSTEAAHLSPSWYAELEPECFAASALKVKAILLGLGRAAQKCSAQEEWRKTAWLTAVVPSLDTDKLRMARNRDAESGVSQLRYEQRGRLYFYEVHSVCLQWPEFAEAIQRALARESFAG